jgi:predicted Fe-S protein YdhL (DUF1289 family)
MAQSPDMFDVNVPVSPCTGVCTLDAAGLCLGCRRTLAEIARWGVMSDDERRHWIREVQPKRPPASP